MPCVIVDSTWTMTSMDESGRIDCHALRHDDSSREFRWSAVFPTTQLSAVFQGSESTLNGAYAALFTQARAIRSTRETDFLPYCTLSVGRAYDDAARLTMPLTDLALDDRELIGRLAAEAADRVARVEAQNRAIEDRAQRGPTRYATKPSSVPEQMRRIHQWLSTATNHPARGPGTDALRRGVESAQSSDANPWPNELIELLTLPTSSARITPYGTLYRLDEMVAARARLIGGRDRFQGEYGSADDHILLAASESDPAGSPASAFLDAFVPIAGDDKDYVVVDLRGGDLNGSVSVYMNEGDTAGPQWMSISAMLSDIADSLETRVPFNDVWVPASIDNELVWDAP